MMKFLPSESVFSHSSMAGKMPTALTWFRENTRRIWQSLFVVATLMLLVGVATDTTDTTRYANRMERLMADGRYADALLVGEHSDKTDARLTALRIKALGHTRQLGNRLFTYPISGDGTPWIRRGGDYALCGYLVNRQLDRFASLLARLYPINGQLPRHYQEALVLYRHVSAHPLINYENSVMETDFNDLRKLHEQYPHRNEWLLNLQSAYEGTYWYYYYAHEE